MKESDPKRSVTFRAPLILAGTTATGIAVPETVVEDLGAGKRVKVVVTINGYSYRSSFAPRGGEYMLPVSAEHRQGAGINAGDDVEVELEVDTAPREVTVPEDLAGALDTDVAARQIFDGLAYSHRLRYVLWIEGTKVTETRRRRVEKALAMLKEGK
jgi:hypothetical protein